MAALGMDDLCFLPSLRAEEMIVLSRMTAANWWLRGGAEAPDRNAWLDAIGAACEFVPDAELLPDYSAYATAGGNFRRAHSHAAGRVRHRPPG